MRVQSYVFFIPLLHTNATPLSFCYIFHFKPWNFYGGKVNQL